SAAVRTAFAAAGLGPQRFVLSLRSTAHGSLPGSYVVRSRYSGRSDGLLRPAITGVVCSSPLLRSRAAAAWAGSPSASASSPGGAAGAAAARSSSSCHVLKRRKSWTERPDHVRARPAVGSTWFAPVV